MTVNDKWVDIGSADQFIGSSMRHSVHEAPRLRAPINMPLAALSGTAEVCQTYASTIFVAALGQWRDPALNRIGLRCPLRDRAGIACQFAAVDNKHVGPY